VKILETYGPLAMLLYTRIEKMSKKTNNFFDLGVLSISMDGMKFIQRVLNFFTNNIRDALTNEKNR
jgi:hypothetical protein